MALPSNLTEASRSGVMPRSERHIAATRSHTPYVTTLVESTITISATAVPRNHRQFNATQRLSQRKVYLHIAGKLAVSGTRRIQTKLLTAALLVNVQFFLDLLDFLVTAKTSLASIIMRRFSSVSTNNCSVKISWFSTIALPCSVTTSAPIGGKLFWIAS